MPSDMLVSVLMDTFVIRDLGDLLRVTKGHMANTYTQLARELIDTISFFY